MQLLVEEKREAYLIAREKAESIPSSLAHSDEPKYRGHGKAEDRLIRLAEAREEYVNAAYDAILKMDEIAWFLMGVPDIEGNVLSDRYVARKTWKQIAEGQNKALSTVYNAHKRGLDIVQGMLDNNYGNDVVNKGVLFV